MGSADESESSNTVQRKSIKIVLQSTISSVALLADGQQFLSGDKNGKIRRWWMEDGKGVGALDAGSAVRCLATSQDGKWIAAGMESGLVTVWNAKSRKELRRFAREKGANSVDISSDGTKIAIAWDDKTVEVCSLPDGKALCDWGYYDFHTIKFSPDGLLFACGADEWDLSFLCIYDTRGGKPLGGSLISAIRSVAWASDSKQLFALSSDGDIHCVDVSSGETLSQWSIHSNDNPTCISLSSNGAFIAASANSSVSFWDTSTHEQIGSVIRHPGSVNSMAISPNYDLVIAGNLIIALWDMFDVFFTPNNQVSEFGLHSQFALLTTAETGYRLSDHWSIFERYDQQAPFPARRRSVHSQTEGRCPTKHHQVITCRSCCTEHHVQYVLC